MRGGRIVALLAVLTVGCGAKSAAGPLHAGAAPAGGVPVAVSSSDAPTILATTSTAPVIPRWPLTGAIADAAAFASPLPVVAVKVDNSPWARPHAGINDADQVYELQVEGITRFMELYHSKQPDRIGPVRSARSSDIDLFANLSRPLLVWSGGNPGVTNEVKEAEANNILTDVGHGSIAEGDYYRDYSNGRQAPHNLYTSLPKIRADFTPADSGIPKPMFRFRVDGDALPASAVDAPGMVIDFGQNVRIEYAWDAERSGWDRFQIDEQHSRARSAFVDEAGVQIAPDNVVILFLSYSPDPLESKSPKANSLGDGDGVVLTQGKAINVHWHRGDPTDAWNLTDTASGEPVALTSGRTWVALPQQDDDHLEPIDAAGAAALLKWRI